ALLSYQSIQNQDRQVLCPVAPRPVQYVGTRAPGGREINILGVFEQRYYKAFTEKELRSALKNTPELFGDAFHFVVKTFYPNLLVE
ncbi:MAG: hypothetical protein HY978_00310, partial [Candidatus Liptonbacteria bacterium]|nr:hypothetical protein [Candidatus Liptonbacteria bacterium]